MWKTLDDLASQLAEFEMRIAGEEYDAAASVLLEIDSDYLLLWGHARLAADLHERLKGHLTDRKLMHSSSINLGICYYSLGDYPRAIDYYQQSLAIAREIGNRQGEGAALGNLGNCYYRLGDFPRAIDYYQQSLAIAREIGNRRGEGNALGNLGNCYYSLGDSPAPSTITSNISLSPAKSETAKARAMRSATWGTAITAWATSPRHRLLPATSRYRPRNRKPPRRGQCARQPGELL